MEHEYQNLNLSVFAIASGDDADEPEWLNPVIQYMIDHFADDLTLDDLASSVGLSKFNFCRQFHRYRGLPPLKWLWKFRLMLAHELLQLPLGWSIQEIAFSCGFSSPAHFSRIF